jgi:predicted O-methyltransferase YrrM
MPSIAKQTIKAILPAPLLHWAKDLSEAVRLSLLSERFDPSRLLRTTRLPLADLFTNRDAEACWAEDSAVIERLYGTSERAGGVNPGDRRALHHLVSFLGPMRILEIGTHVGASTVHIAMAAKRTGGRVTTVDITDINAEDGPWRRAGLPASPRDLCAQLGCQVEFKEAGGAAYLRSSTESFDLIFLDGDHSAPAVYTELALAMARVAEGGIIVLHDFYPDGPFFHDELAINGPARAVRRALREVAGFIVLPLGGLPWPTKRGSNMTSLAVVLGS